MRSAVVVALAYLIDPETPKNDGAFRPLEVIAKEGTVVWARPGAPVTLCTNHCGQEIIEAIIKALAPACPDRAMAGWGRRFRIALQGTDPRSGKAFIWHLFQARPGGGASPAGDGWPAAGEWQAAGGIKFGSLEVAEVRFPLFFRRHEFRPDSGGDGRYRGGPGAELELVVEVAEPAVANTAGDGIRHGACGILGGADGQPHRYVLKSGRPTGSPAQDQGGRHRDPARRRARRPLRRRRRLRRSGPALARRARPRPAAGLRHRGRLAINPRRTRSWCRRRSGHGRPGCPVGEPATPLAASRW